MNGISLGDFIVNFFGDDSKLNQQLDGMKGSISEKLSGISTAAGGILTGMGAAITGTLTGLTMKFVDLGSELADTSARTGVSAESLSELKFALEQSGTSLDVFEVGLKKMALGFATVREQAASGKEATSGYGGALQQIGVDVAALQSMNPEQQFLAIANGLAGVTDHSTQAALATELFGKAGIDMLPFINEGSAGIEQLRQQAEALGLTMTDESASQAEAFGDLIDQVKSAFTAFAIAVGPILVETLTPILEWIKEAIIKFKEWRDNSPGTFEAFVKIAAVIGGVAAVLGPLLLLLPTLIASFSAIGTVIGVIGGAFALLAGPVGIAIAVIGGLIAIGYAVYSNWESITGMLSSLWNGFKDIASGVWEGISNALSSIWEGLKSVASSVWEGIVAVLTIAWNFITAPYKLLWEVIKQVSQGIAEVFNWLYDGIQSVWDGIVGAFTWAYDTITGIWDSLTSGLSAGFSVISDAIGWLTQLLGFGGSGVEVDMNTHARGTSFAPGGLSLVGEEGPELVNLPRGSRVFTANETASMLGNNSSSQKTIQINFGGLTVNGSNLSVEDISTQLATKLERKLISQGAFLNG